MLTVREKKFFYNKKILIIGHTGFCGSWMTLIMSLFTKQIYGIALAPNKNQKLFDFFNLKKISKSKFINICNYQKLKNTIKKINPHIIFHLASQPIVLESYKKPIDTLKTNVIGTANILNICREIKVLQSLVIITSDKCYENKENKNFFLESDPLGGEDIYSASKACQEIITNSFRKNFFLKNKCPVSTARAGNIIGGGDWTNNRLIPDFFKSYASKKTLIIRNPHSVRPWQYILDVILGYMKLAYKQHASPKLQGAWNFGPIKQKQKTVYDIIKLIKSVSPDYNRVKIKFKKLNVYESQILNLNSNKANKILKWNPNFDIKQNLKNTLDWYLINKNKILDYSIKHIKDYYKI